MLRASCFVLRPSLLRAPGITASCSGHHCLVARAEKIPPTFRKEEEEDYARDEADGHEAIGFRGFMARDSPMIQDLLGIQ